MTDTTTVRVHKSTRDRLARLSRQLQADSTEDVVTRALDLLETDLFWRQWQAVNSHAPASTMQGVTDEEAVAAAWEQASARDWSSDADR